jgi:hypothetical protein
MRCVCRKYGFKEPDYSARYWRDAYIKDPVMKALLKLFDDLIEKAPSS